MFSVRFDKHDEDDQVLDKINIIQSLLQCHIDKIDIQSQLERQTRNQKLKDSCWRFDKKKSVTIYLYKTRDLNASSLKKFQ